MRGDRSWASKTRCMPVLLAAFALGGIVVPMAGQTDATGYRVLRMSGIWQWAQGGENEHEQRISETDFLPEKARVSLRAGQASDYLTLVSLRDASLRKITCSGSQFNACRDSIELISGGGSGSVSLLAALKPYLGGLFILLEKKVPDEARPMITQLSRGEGANVTRLETVIPLGDDTRTALNRLLPGLPDGEYSATIQREGAVEERVAFELLQGQSSKPLPMTEAGFYAVRVYEDGKREVAAIAVLIAPVARAGTLQEMVRDTRTKLKESNLLSSANDVDDLLEGLLLSMGRELNGGVTGGSIHAE